MDVRAQSKQREEKMWREKKNKVTNSFLIKSQTPKKNRIYLSRYFFTFFYCNVFCRGASFILFDIEKLACFESFLLPGNYTMGEEKKRKNT